MPKPRFTKDAITLAIVNTRVRAIRGGWTPQERQARKEEGERRRAELALLLGHAPATAQAG